MKLYCLWSALILALGCTACSGKGTAILISNPYGEDIGRQEVEVCWDSLRAAMPELEPGNFIIRDAGGCPCPYQLVYGTEGQPVAVLLLVGVKAGSQVRLECMAGRPPVFAPQVYGRAVPERMDDFAWENDRVAFRMYGPALERSGEISNGMDIWAKRTDSLVIDRWYRRNDYHRDHGEGLDFYKVGRSLGAGMTAPVSGPALVLGRNYTSWEILEKGPLRFTFRLEYAPFKVGTATVREVRTISLAAGSHFNRVAVSYTGDFDSLRIASGIVLRGDRGERTADASRGFISYGGPSRGKDGRLFVGVIVPDRKVDTAVLDGHLTISSPVACGETLVYYAGNGWSRAGVSDGEAWQDILDGKLRDISSPLKVSIVDSK